MVTISAGLERAVQGDTMRRCGGSTKSDRCFSSDRKTIELTSKTHKPADSYVPVGNDARCCSFHEISAEVLKR